LIVLVHHRKRPRVALQSSNIHGFAAGVPQLIGMHEVPHGGCVMAATGERGLDRFLQICLAVCRSQLQ
jgi:hypothetical protein